MSGKNFKLSFVIGAVDNITYKVMAINEKMKTLSKPFKEVGTAFKTLANESGSGRLLSSVKAVGSAAGEVGAAFRRILSTAAGFGLAAAGAFKFLVLDSYKSIATINDLNDRLGFTTDTIQGLQFAAAKSGVDVDSMGQVLQKFHQMVSNARTTPGGEEAMIFNAFGMSIDQLRKLKPDEILARTGAGLNKITDASLRNTVAMKLFGGQGSKFVQVLKDIPGSIKDARAAGLIIGPEAMKNAEDFKKSWNVLLLTFTRLRDVVGAELMPVFSSMFGDLLVVIKENKTEIVAWAQEFATKLPGYIKQFTAAVSGLVSVLLVVGSVFSSIVDFLGPSGVKFLTLGVIIAKLAPAVWAVTSAVWGLGAALLATPLGWIALGIAGIVAAVMNWDKVMEGLLWTWEKIKSIASTVGGFIGLGDVSRPAANAGIARQTAALGAPVLGPSMGVAPAIRGQAITQTNRTENRIAVDFRNMPRGVNVISEQAEAPIDITRGVSMLPGY